MESRKRLYCVIEDGALRFFIQIGEKEGIAP
jgi:hypothetical protein